MHIHVRTNTDTHARMHTRTNTLGVRVNESKVVKMVQGWTPRWRERLEGDAVARRRKGVVNDNPPHLSLHWARRGWTGCEAHLRIPLRPLSPSSPPPLSLSLCLSVCVCVYLPLLNPLSLSISSLSVFHIVVVWAGSAGVYGRDLHLIIAVGGRLAC
jgi:hypothetical protein